MSILLNNFYSMTPFSLYHILLMLLVAIIFVGLGFALKFAGKHAQKIALIVLWVALVVNYVLYFVLHAFTPLFTSDIRYNPIKWVLVYIFQYMEFLPLIFLGVAVLKKKKNAHFTRMMCFYLITLWGILGLFIKGQTLGLDYTTNYRGMFGGNGGFMMGLLTKDNFWYYVIQKVIYIVLPIYMAVFGFFKPKFGDIPKVAISFIVLIFIANIFNNFCITAHENLRLFYVTNSGLSNFYSNVLYTKSPDGMPMLTWFYNLCSKTAVWYLVPVTIVLIPIWLLMTTPFYKLEFYKNFKQNFKNYFINLKKYWLDVFTRPVDFEDKNKTDELK